jgi:hypothetical protein
VVLAIAIGVVVSLCAFGICVGLSHFPAWNARRRERRKWDRQQRTREKANPPSPIEISVGRAFQLVEAERRARETAPPGWIVEEFALPPAAERSADEQAASQS